MKTKKPKKAPTPKHPGLTPKQARFVSEYLIDLNGKQAAIRCGYSVKNAEFQGSKLLAQAKVKQAVEAGKTEQIKKTSITAARVLEEIRRLAYLDVADLFDKSGRLLPLHKMPVEARVAINGLEVARANLDKTDGKRSTEWLHKIKLESKTKSLEMLGRHLALFNDTLKVTGADEALLSRIGRARDREAALAKSQKP